MATHIQKSGSDLGAWGPVHNDFHRTTNGGYEWFDIVANGNNPPTIKQYSRFQIWGTDASYSIPAVATGNNNYPQSTTPTYLNSEAIFEDGADLTFTWAGTVRGETIATQSDGTWYVICKNSLDTDASTKGQGVYNVSKTETPTYSGQKGGYYSSGGFRVLASFVSTSGVVSAVTILNYPNLPNTDGGADQIAVTDGSGSIAWEAKPSAGVTATTGAGAPASAPSTEGDIYIDTTNDESYIATDTSASSDFKPVSSYESGKGSYEYSEVDGTKTKVFTKYLSGTLDADSKTSVAHGVTDYDKIVNVSVSVVTYTSDNSFKKSYITSETFYGSIASLYSWVYYDNTDITINFVGGYIQGNDYKIIIKYYE